MNICCPHCQEMNNFDACQLAWEDGDSTTPSCVYCGMTIWVLALQTIDHEAFKTEEEMDNR